MKRRQLFDILKRIWNQIYKQLTQFSLRLKAKKFNYVDAEYQVYAPGTKQTYQKVPTFIQTELVPERLLLPEPVPAQEMVTPTVEAHEQPIENETSIEPIQAANPSKETSSYAKKEPTKVPLRLAVDKIPIIEMAKLYGWL